jgi:hypothetical protein
MEIVCVNCWLCWSNLKSAQFASSVDDCFRENPALCFTNILPAVLLLVLQIIVKFLSESSTSKKPPVFGRWL